MVAELVARFTQLEVPHAPILSVLEALNSPQSQARGVVVEVDHPALGPIPLVNRPIRYADEEQAPVTAPPMLGQDTDAILADLLGLDEDRIAALRAAGTVA
jgi:crotonobetainyl-CoA:carnitine CoA-transferase CaiB-like acyl-CoA transferase